MTTTAPIELGRTGRWAATLALAVALGAAPSRAMAHGREATFTAITFDPATPAHIIATATWGIATTEDGGASFGWRCAAAVGFDRATEDPRVAVVEGAWLIGTFDGLRTSRDGCGFAGGPPEVRGAYAIDVVIDRGSAQSAFVLLSPGNRPNTVLHTEDGGLSFALRGTLPESFLAERLVQRGETVVVSGAFVPFGGGRRIAVLVSRDGGRTFPHEAIVPTEDDGERNAHVLAIDPSGSDRFILRMVRRVTDPLPERVLRTDDGGMTWVRVHQAAAVTGAAWVGEQVWVSSRADGLARSDDSGRTFTPLASVVSARCVAARRGVAMTEVFVCADARRDGFAIGVSRDDGGTFEPFLRNMDIPMRPGCPTCSPVGSECPAYWPDLAYDLVLGDAGPPPPPTDAGPVTSCGDTGGIDAGPPSAPPSGCRCALSPHPPSAWWPCVAFAVSYAGRMRQRLRARTWRIPGG